MKFLGVILALQVAGLYAADTTCSNGTYLYLDATACNDIQSTAACAAIFPPGTDPLTAGGDIGNRPEKCSDDSLHDLAVSQCPKTCGYCCLTPAYNCTNDVQPSEIDCTTMTAAQCNSTNYPELAPKVQYYCPNLCGTCNAPGACVDAPGVPCQQAWCYEPDMKSTVDKDCRRTCRLCTGPGSSTINPFGSTASSYKPTVKPSSPSGCVDNDPHCTEWALNGFCQKYPVSVQQQYCPKTCNLC